LAAGLLNYEAENFIMQDTEAVVSHLPGFSQKIINTVTDIGATVDVLLHGDALNKRITPYK
jgi:hypothetical protein